MGRSRSIDHFLDQLSLHSKANRGSGQGRMHGHHLRRRHGRSHRLPHGESMRRSLDPRKYSNRSNGIQQHLDPRLWCQHSLWILERRPGTGRLAVQPTASRGRCNSRCAGQHLGARTIQHYRHSQRFDEYGRQLDVRWIRHCLCFRIDHR